MKINWLKVAQFIAQYAPQVIEAIATAHAQNQAAKK